MAKRSRTIRLRGEDVRLIFRSQIWDKDENGEWYECDGLADPPGTKDRAIRIKRSVADAYKLEMLIHEMWHVCQWDLDESVIKEIAHDVAKVLHDLGYREARP